MTNLLQIVGIIAAFLVAGGMGWGVSRNTTIRDLRTRVKDLECAQGDTTLYLQVQSIISGQVYEAHLDDGDTTNVATTFDAIPCN